MVADIGLSVIGVSGVIITAILKTKSNGRKNSSPQSDIPLVTEKFCNERHRLLEKDISEIKEGVQRLLERDN